MAATEEENDAMKVQYLSTLKAEILNYVNLEEPPSTKSLRASIINDCLNILDAYGLTVNLIYKYFPDTLRALFSSDGPGNEVRDILLEKGFDVNTKTTDGDYPLHQACYMGNAAVAQYLLRRGAKFDSVHNGYTAAALASSHSDFNISAIALDSECKEFIEQYILVQNSMFLAHRWSINGYGRLGNDKFKKLTYADPILLRNSLCQSFVKFSDANKEKLLDACKKVSADVTDADIKQLIENIDLRFRAASAPDLKTLADKIASGATCPLDLNTVFPDGGKHHEAILFYDFSKIMRLNRGEGSDGRTGVEMNTITKPENIPKFLSSLNGSLTNLDAGTFHANIEEQLGLEKIRLINMKEQVSPTCKWTSEKALFYGVIYSEILSLFKNKGVDKTNIDDYTLAITRSWYKGVTKKDRVDMLKVVLDMFPGKTIQEMPMLVKEMLYKIYHKSKSKQKYSMVVKMLDEKGMEDYYKMNQQFLEALQKESEDALLEYIERGVIGNQCADYIYPVLYVMIDRGFHKATKALLENGTSPNPVPPAIISILNMAINKEDLEMVDLLLAYGAEASHLHLKAIDELRKKILQRAKPPIGSQEEVNLSLTTFSNQFQRDKIQTGMLLTLATLEGEKVSPEIASSVDLPTESATTPVSAEGSPTAASAKPAEETTPPKSPTPPRGSKKS